IIVHSFIHPGCWSKMDGRASEPVEPSYGEVERERRLRAARTIAAAFVPAVLLIVWPPVPTRGQVPPFLPRDVGGAVAPTIVSPIPRVTPPPQPQIVPAPALPAQPAPVVPEGPPVHIDDVRVEGVTVYDVATLRPVYALVGTTVPRSRVGAVVEA